MAMFKTTDMRLVDHCIKAMSKNTNITETFRTQTGATTITGKVQSVIEDRQTSSRCWTITIITDDIHRDLRLLLRPQ
jgi:hypothetical protein